MYKQCFAGYIMDEWIKYPVVLMDETPLIWILLNQSWFDIIQQNTFLHKEIQVHTDTVLLHNISWTESMTDLMWEERKKGVGCTFIALYITNALEEKFECQSIKSFQQIWHQSIFERQKCIPLLLTFRHAKLPIVSNTHKSLIAFFNVRVRNEMGLCGGHALDMEINWIDIN